MTKTVTTRFIPVGHMILEDMPEDVETAVWNEIRDATNAIGIYSSQISHIAFKLGVKDENANVKRITPEQLVMWAVVTAT